LVPASSAYSLGWRAYCALYDLGIKLAAKPHSPIVCVGNLTVGGTGKTPLTLLVADLLTELGHSVVIGASGYGSPRAEAAMVAPEGDLDPAEWGDEPALYRMLRPEIPLIVGRRRVLAAELCASQFAGSVLLMDDGMQHLPLAKDVQILIEAPGSNRFCLPAGPYREPYSRRSRASLRLGPGGDFGLRYVFGGLRGETGENEVDVLCALGDPQRFVTMLEENGYRVMKRKLLSDHDPMSAPDLLDGFEQRPLVVTAKDWVKLRSRPAPGVRILVAEYAVEVDGDLRGWLAGKVPRSESSR
jgi:tetraacyldisaccharide 4'-kinase